MSSAEAKAKKAEEIRAKAMAPSFIAAPIKVLCPAERHITVAFPEIYNIVKTTMTVGQRQRYEEVCQLVESLYAQEFMTLRRNVKQNFLAFSVGAKGQELPTRKGRSLPPKADLNMREEKLVADFLQLMAAARYNLMTSREWDVAMAERFLFHLPVKVNWDFFDAKLLAAFWSSNHERRALRAELPDLSDRILIFHRGIGVAKDQGMYINQKVDLIVDYLLVTPILRLWAWLCAFIARVFRLKTKAPSNSSMERSGSSTIMGGAQQQSQASGGMLSAESGEVVLKHKAERFVERRTLRRVLPTTWSVIKNMHKTLHLQEPMYKEVVVLYRTSGEGRKGKKCKGPVKARSNADRLTDILARRNIHVKCFHDIPMADMEVIFPDKKIFLKSLSIINMAVQGGMAFFGAIAGLARNGEINLQAVWSALSLVAARCGQLYSAMQAERSEMVQDMVNILYDKTNDAQEGVLSMLLEDMAEQQLKEAVLAYTMLYLRIDDEVTEEELDYACEKFLDDNFGLRLDFAVEDAIPNLLNWGMIKCNHRNGKYQALPVETAYTALTRHWVKAYEALSKPPNPKILPLTALLAGGDRTPVSDSNPDAAQQANGVVSSSPFAAEPVTPKTGGAEASPNLPKHSFNKANGAATAKSYHPEAKKKGILDVFKRKKNKSPDHPAQSIVA